MDMKVNNLEKTITKETLDEYRERYQIAKQYQIEVGQEIGKLIRDKYGTKKIFAEYLSENHGGDAKSIATMLSSFEKGNLGIFPARNSSKSPNSYSNLTRLSHVFTGLEISEEDHIVEKTQRVNDCFAYGFKSKNK